MNPGAKASGFIILGNNIAVDPKVVCHTERSEPTVDARRGQSQVSLFSALLRSFTFVIRYAHREHLLMISLRYGQDDKFTQKMKQGSTHILLPYFIITSAAL